MRNLSPLTSGFVVIIEEVANHSACILSYVDPCFIFVINTQIGTFLELLYRPDLFIRYLFSCHLLTWNKHVAIVTDFLHLGLQLVYCM